MGDTGGPRGYVVIVGPDGSGKSTVVEAIVARAAEFGIAVARAHHRPGLIAGPPAGVGPVTDPHSEPPRSAVASLAKLALVFADYVFGDHLRWRAQRRTGLLLLERGWFDMAVDPRRYRLAGSLTHLVRLLGWLLPRPDVLLLLTGDPGKLHARKPEIGVPEVDRQIRRWREIASAAGRRVVEVDTVCTGPETAAAAMFTALPGADSSNQAWRRIPLTAGRLELRSTGAAMPALAVYRPFSLRARMGIAVGPRLLRVSGRRVPEPFSDLPDLWRTLGIAPDGVVAMRSSTPDRQLLAVCRDGKMSAILKIGDCEDSRLRHEAMMLAGPLRDEVSIRRPKVMWSGNWKDHFVLVTEPVELSSKAKFTAQELVPLVSALGSASESGAPLTHGDLAPWNLVRTANGPVLLDWEVSRWSDEPLHDLAHFVVQAGALLGRYSPQQAVSLLCGPNSPGRQVLVARRRDFAEAHPLLCDYLARARPTVPRAVSFRDEMLRLTALGHSS
jgi:hypothetical protein